MSHRLEHSTGAACAIAGSLLLLMGTLLHPMDADPHDSLAAFSEYAADSHWVASHLLQLAGMAAMVAALLLLAKQLRTGGSAICARFGAASAIAGLALAAALQAVDGVALKIMVDSWAAAATEQKDMLFQASFAVRQLEVGFASLLSLAMGLSVSLFGAALLTSRHFPRWLGGLAIAGGLPTAVSGVVMAYSGFSALVMDINMPASSLLLIWMLALGLQLWRRRAAPAD